MIICFIIAPTFTADAFPAGSAAQRDSTSRLSGWMLAAFDWQVPLAWFVASKVDLETEVLPLDRITTWTEGKLPLKILTFVGPYHMTSVHKKSTNPCCDLIESKCHSLIPFKREKVVGKADIFVTLHPTLALKNQAIRHMVGWLHICAFRREGWAIACATASFD
jgi:hypothetical protein